MNAAGRQSALWVVLMSVALALPSMAQMETASLSGRVTDPRGAVVPHTVIEAVQQNTNIGVKTQTNGDGLYYLPSLRPGSYKVIVSKDGFKQIIQPHVQLDVQDAVTLNFALEIGSVMETVTIYAEAPQLRTQDASVSTLITREQLENMPLNGRSLQTLIMLAPGITLAPPNGGFAANNTANPGQFSSNGQRSYSNYFMVDGVSANAGTDRLGSGSGFSGGQPALTASGTTQSLVSVDSLQEFRIQTSTYAPEFGRSPGAQIELLTRSGNNRFHGSLFEYLRNNIFDGADWFAHGLGQRSPELRQNDFGGTLGGPVLFPGFNGHDRTFFFFSYEGLRLRQPSFAVEQVPSLATRQTTVPSILPLINAFPLPTGADQVDPVTLLPTGFAEFAKGHSVPITINGWSVRIDHHFNSRFSVFGRYSKSPSDLKGRDLADVSSDAHDSQTATVGATLLFSPRVLNDFRWNFTRSSVTSSDTLDNFGGAVPPADSLLFPAPFASRKDSQLLLTLENDSGGVSYFTGTQAANLQRQFNFVDSVSVTKGSHAIKFGIDYRRLFPVVGPNKYSQFLDFTTGNFFDPIDGLTSGIVSNFLLTTQATDLKPVFVNLSLYAQDTWHVTPHLTLTYGLRWEFNPLPHNSNGPDPTVLTGLSDPATFAVAPPGTPLYPTRYNDFAPRVGLAYQFGHRGGWETVLRAGTGIFYDVGSTEVTNAFFGFPFQANSFLQDANYPLTQDQLAPPQVTVDGATFNVYDPKTFNLPRTIQWNVALAQSLGGSQTLTASYVGSIGRRLLQVTAYSSPNAVITGDAEVYRSTATADYNALQVQYQRRLSHGVQALGSYTWSHAIDDLSDDGQFFGESSRGNSNFDIRQNLSASLSYDIPAFSRDKVARGILGGWGLDTIVHAQSAAPVNAQAALLFAPTGQKFAIRPDVVPGVPMYISGNHCPSLDLSIPDGLPCPGGRRINPLALTRPPKINGVRRQGTLGRNQLRGLPLSQVDLAVRRQFKLTEHLNLQFRVDAFNLLNHPNFGNVNHLLSSETFGEPQTMRGGEYGGLNSLYQIGGPRSLQLSLKLAF